MMLRPTSATFRRLYDVVEYLVDDSIGIVRAVAESPRAPGTPDFFHFGAVACNTRAFTRQENFSATGGAAADRDSALAKAIGEAVERYCSAIYDIDDLPLTAYDQAPFPCVPPNAFALYSAEQYQSPGFIYVPFEDSTPVRWVAARDLGTGEEIYVPAGMVYVPYAYYRGTGDSPIAEPISTGLACHLSSEEAMLAALFEVIERDAFTITWQARLARPQIRIETLSDANFDLIRRFERAAGSVTVLDITLDTGVPAILSVLRHSWPGAPALVFAAAADLNPEKAVRKSLEELAHTRRYMQQINSELPRLVPEPNYENVVDQITHLNLYCDPTNAPLADFIFKSEERIAFDEIENLATGHPKRDLKTLVARVQAVNHRALVVDLTTPDVSELGFTVMRGVIPGFHPLQMGHRYRALGGYRLWEVPQRLGDPGITRESGDNSAPHPFP
jgi:ribosomal protein S12 methylthiotransferase accessory factor